MNNVQPWVKVQKIHEAARLPAYAKPGDAGADLCAVEKVWITPGETAIVPLGLAIETPWHLFATIRPRSSLTKKGILCGVGTIDSGYRGEIAATLTNTGKSAYRVMPGDRIAQIVIEARIEAHFELAPGLSQSERGSAGFGSTGT